MTGEGEKCALGIDREQNVIGMTASNKSPDLYQLFLQLYQYTAIEDKGKKAKA